MLQFIWPAAHEANTPGGGDESLCNAHNRRTSRWRKAEYHTSPMMAGQEIAESRKHAQPGMLSGSDDFAAAC